MNRSELPAFPITLFMSVFLHATAFIVWSPICGCNLMESKPELIPSRPGVVSVKLVASAAARPRQSEPTDPPLVREPLLRPPMADLKTSPFEEPPLERPRERNESTPVLAAATKVMTPAAVPDLDADLFRRLTTTAMMAKQKAPQPLARPRLALEPTLPAMPRRMVAEPATVPEMRAELVRPPIRQEKRLDPMKPATVVRPKVNQVELPKLEIDTKVAELASAPSLSSQESEGSVEELPRKLAINPPPPYPESAGGRLGTVIVRVMISAEGRVTAISLYTSSGVPALDDSVLSTVRRWVFEPARRSGRAVPFEVTVPVEFFRRRS